MLEPRSTSFSSECTPTRPEDEEPRLLLAGEGEDLLEALAVEQRDGEIDAVIGGQLAADLQVRLVDLGQARYR